MGPTGIGGKDMQCIQWIKTGFSDDIYWHKK